MQNIRDFVHRLYPYQALKGMIRPLLPVAPIQVSSSPLTCPSRTRQVSTEFDPVQARSKLVEYFRALDRIESGKQGAGIDRKDWNQEWRMSIREQRRVSGAFLGFWLEVGESRIPNAGRGVFLRRSTTPSTSTTTRSTYGSHFCPAGTIVAMYPGTLYQPGEAIFFNSIHNRYILKCQDGIYVDGKVKGLSGAIFRSLDGRDNFPGIVPSADRTWMKVGGGEVETRKRGMEEEEDEGELAVLRNPLAIGQLVNNGTKMFPSNVRYQELDMSTRDCPLNLQKYLPNIWHIGDWHSYDHDHVSDSGPSNEQTQEARNGLDYLRTVVLVTTRDVQPNEELYSTYIE